MMSSVHVTRLFAGILQLLDRYRGCGTSTTIGNAANHTSGIVITANNKDAVDLFPRTNTVSLEELAYPPLKFLGERSQSIHSVLIDNHALIELCKKALVTFQELKESHDKLEQDRFIQVNKHLEAMDRVRKLEEAAILDQSKLRDNERLIKATAEMLADREMQLLALQLHVIKLEDINYIQNHDLFTFNDKAKLAEYINNNQKTEVIKERIAIMNQAWKDAGKPSDTNKS